MAGSGYSADNKTNVTTGPYESTANFGDKITFGSYGISGGGITASAPAWLWPVLGFGALLLGGFAVWEWHRG